MNLLYRLNKAVLPIFALCMLSMQGIAAPTTNPPDIEIAKTEPAIVRVQGDSLYYTGNFSAASTKAFDSAVAGVRKGQLTRLVIYSGGGDTVAGRHVGRWVRDMGLVVEVDVICFSSCADYVFPAGRARVIRKDAFVGWHGNERQFTLLAERQGVPLTDILRHFAPADAPKAAVDAFVAELSDSIAKTQKDEAEFYASLGLSDAFAVCAVGDEVEMRFGFTGKKGWGFSIDDMVRLGMNNITYLDDGVYEKSSVRVKQHLVTITADDCLALLK
jgi:hypothetical protein